VVQRLIEGVGDKSARVPVSVVNEIAAITRPAD
jgi:hypothetical protein